MLNRHFYASKPSHKLVTDITYLKCTGGFVYLSAIKDLFNKEIVAFSFSRTCDTTLCNETVNILMKDRVPTGDMILHSDQGCTYTSALYQQKLKDLCINQSFSRVGNCWDNAVMESFFGTLKDYLRSKFGKQNYANGRISSRLIIQESIKFIEYYNEERKQKSLGNLSPKEYLSQNKNGTEMVLYGTNFCDLKKVLPQRLPVVQNN